MSENARSAVVLLPVFALQLCLSLLAVWRIPSPVTRGLVLGGISAAAFSCSFLLLRSAGKRLPVEPLTREPVAPSPVEAAQELPPLEEGEPSQRTGMTMPDKAVWEEWKRMWREADRLLENSPQPHAFSDAWTAFGESLDRLQANSRLILENSKKSFDISDNLSGTAEKAFALSQQVQAKVKELTDELAASLEETRRLSEESKKIVKILEMMNEISSKTYVLSINASVVATRAGIHGRAFDVVAKEIRKLAQETENSLKSIEDFVGNIQAIVKNVVDHTTITSGEIDREKDSLLSVAGALQGVILAVEIIRTVSNLSKEKAQEQQTISEEVIAKTRQVASRIQAESSEDQMKDVREKIRKLRQVLDRY